ncbi:hypothetical protein [Pandoraea eparura]|uniref:hypothetical protein n=1 Tax=Pandoraea eparura TaxID=2508291 RepID=UPI0012411EA4|nr:hypothetical protein [Pandoraea eparura]
MNYFYVSVKNDPSIRVALAKLNQNLELVPVIPLGPEVPDAGNALVRCIEVHLTGYGFLRLVPDQEGKTHGTPAVALAIPLGLVNWVLESGTDSTKELGFL